VTPFPGTAGPNGVAEHGTLSARALGLGAPDPSGPAAALEAMDSFALRRLAQDTIEIARAVSTGAGQVRVAAPELTRGWSAAPPNTAVRRVAGAADDTAILLFAHSGALEQTAETIDRAVSDARLDRALAVAEINRIDHHSWTEAAAALVGVPHLGGGLEVVSVLRRLFRSLEERIASVDVALLSLQSTLGRDPTEAPDALRAGPSALLPADPVMNPAYRTDQENRASLVSDLHSGVPTRMRFAASILHSLRQAADLGGSSALIVYDSRAYQGQGRAAVAVGDLTTATSVAVLVPGIASSPSDMGGGIGLAADLRDEANRQDPLGRTAVVAWYGYDIPMSWIKDPGSHPAGDISDTLAIGSAANAAAGAPVLAADLDRIKAMSQSSERTTLIGFSMGSTTVSEAARLNLPVDSLVLLGSPGAGWDTRSAGGYRNVADSDVYVLSYDQDPVTLPITDELARKQLGIADPYGTDPAAESFGGRHIDAGTNVPVATGPGLLVWLGRILGDPRHHSMKNYMQGGALTAEGSIVVGRNDQVPTKRGRIRR
jgi:hypothetical protein